MKKYLVLSFFLFSNLFTMNQESVSLSDLESQIVALTRQIETNDFSVFEKNKSPILLSMLSSTGASVGLGTLSGYSPAMSLLHGIMHGFFIGVSAKTNTQLSSYEIALLNLCYHAVVTLLLNGVYANKCDKNALAMPVVGPSVLMADLAMKMLLSVVIPASMTAIEAVVIMLMKRAPEEQRRILEEELAKLKKEFEKESMKKKALQKEETLSSIESV